MLSRLLLAGVLALSLAPWPADAQQRTPRQDERRERRMERSPRAFSFSFNDDDDRAVLGVSTGSGGKRDTLGLLIVSVTPGGPAEKAGLEEGNRIAAINGVKLTLASADAGESDMRGVLTSRLQREMRKVKAGVEVELRVYANGQTKNVKVKTIEAADLSESRRRVSRQEREERAVLGISLGGSGSRRDTLGIFLIGVTDDGPAAKAGIEEGNRIAAINGVDLRVRAEDAGDSHVYNAKTQRLRRELEKLKAGDDAELRVYANGSFKTTRVKAVKASELYDDEHWGGFFMDGPMGIMFDGPRGELSLPHIAPHAPVPPEPPMRRLHRFEIDDDDIGFSFDVRIDKDVIENAVRAADRGLLRAKVPLRTLERRLDGLSELLPAIEARVARGGLYRL